MTVSNNDRDKRPAGADRTPTGRDGITPQTLGSCPYCASTHVSATGRVTAASYYRCDKCGQVWHPDRVAARPSRR